MTPTMLKPGEFVISFDTEGSRIIMRNPHGGENPENDGNYVLLKKLITGLVQKPEGATIEAIEEKPMNRAELEDYHLKSMVIKNSQFYKDLLEMKAIYDKLHTLGAPEGGFYRAITWALERVEKEA